jgi:hypothetical protein
LEVPRIHSPLSLLRLTHSPVQAHHNDRKALPPHGFAGFKVYKIFNVFIF